jgi:hypothetical protein
VSFVPFLPSLLSKNIKVGICRNVILPVVYVVMKLGVLHEGNFIFGVCVTVHHI